MKYRPILIEVVNRLRSLKYLNSKLYSRLTETAQNDESFEVFEILRSRMVEAGWSIGWNKILRNGSIYSWYANQVTVYPLRLAVMEIESDDELYESCRSQLSKSLSLGWGRHSPTHGRGQACLLSNYILQELGVNTLSGLWDKYSMSVLHRLNLDMRERPIIERWHWAGGVSTVVLSDGGRYQVSRDAVWATAIDAGIGLNGRLDKVMRNFILELLSNSKRTQDLPSEMNNETGKCLTRFLARLEVCRLIRLEVDRVVFIVEPGKFPGLAIKLWG